MTNHTRKQVTVIGAGIGGLTVALCLSQYGIPVRVTEKRTHLTSEGAGIQISPNAFRVLSNLGLADNLITRGFEVKHLTISAVRETKPLVYMSLGDRFHQAHGAPYLVIHRKELLATLYEKALANNIEVSFNKPFDKSSFNNDDTLIGADGVWSDTRSEVNDQTARFSGRIAYRSMMPAMKEASFTDKYDIAMWLAPDTHFILYPIDDKRTLNLVCVVKSPQMDKRWSTHADSNEVLRHLTGWDTNIQQIVDRADQWRRWPLYDVSPKADWAKNNMALLGDAAHAMVPFLAQGGASAIEDAAVLAHALATETDRTGAFKAYQAARYSRVNRIWNEAKSNGERYHWGGALAQVRNLGLKAMGGERLQKRYNWIYGWCPPSL